jgi:Rod binding domain-containing protein
MNTTLQPAKHHDPAHSSTLRPLTSIDYFGAIAPSHVASPNLNPLNTPEFFSAGRFHQLLSDRTTLKPLNLGAAALTPLSDLDVPATKITKGQPQDQHEALTQQTQKWVAQTFFGTLLKQMHEGPFKSHLLDGGRGGEAFQPLMDQQLIDRMSRASGKKLVRGIVRQIEGRQAYRNQPAADGASAAPSNDIRSARNPNIRIHVAPNLRA